MEYAPVVFLITSSDPTRAQEAFWQACERLKKLHLKRSPE
jgi:hypothetical protein